MIATSLKPMCPHCERSDYVSGGEDGNEWAFCDHCQLRWEWRRYEANILEHVRREFEHTSHYSTKLSASESHVLRRTLNNALGEMPVLKSKEEE